MNILTPSPSPKTYLCASRGPDLQISNPELQNSRSSEVQISRTPDLALQNFKAPDLQSSRCWDSEINLQIWSLANLEFWSSEVQSWSSGELEFRSANQELRRSGALDWKFEDLEVWSSENLEFQPFEVLQLRKSRVFGVPKVSNSPVLEFWK